METSLPTPTTARVYVNLLEYITTILLHTTTGDLVPAAVFKHGWRIQKIMAGFQWKKPSINGGWSFAIMDYQRGSIKHEDSTRKNWDIALV